MYHPPRHYADRAREVMADGNLTAHQRQVFADLIAELEQVAEHRDWLRQFQVKCTLAEKAEPVRQRMDEERRRRAEAHRIAALPALADRLASAVFDYAEAERTMVRDHLADRLHGVLLRAGLIRTGRSLPQLTPEAFDRIADRIVARRSPT